MGIVSPSSFLSHRGCTWLECLSSCLATKKRRSVQLKRGLCTCAESFNSSRYFVFEVNLELWYKCEIPLLSCLWIQNSKLIISYSAATFIQYVPPLYTTSIHSHVFVPLNTACCCWPLSSCLFLSATTERASIIADPEMITLSWRLRQSSWGKRFYITLLISGEEQTILTQNDLHILKNLFCTWCCRFQKLNCSRPGSGSILDFPDNIASMCSWWLGFPRLPHAAGLHKELTHAWSLDWHGQKMTSV